MILAPEFSGSAIDASSLVTVRLIGILDGVLIDRFTEACAGLAGPQKRTLIILVRDLVAMRDANLDRFLATLETLRAAGHRIAIEWTPTWRKVARGLGGRFEQSAPADGRVARRQIIVCHSSDKRGAA